MLTMEMQVQDIRQNWRRSARFATRRGLADFVWHDTYRLVGKRLFDLSLLALLFPVVAPAIAIVSLVLLASGRAPFCTQERLGRNGRVIRLIKFQTMDRCAESLSDQPLDANAERTKPGAACHNANDASQRQYSSMDSFLRKHSIDDMPQLLNVLIGDMSFVGPRALKPSEKTKYGPSYEVYASMRPGIISLWDTSSRLEKHFQNRIEQDLRYAATLSLSNDLALLSKTLESKHR